MLIYNFQKEFVGIDEADLEIFGFANLSELKAESSDFADMFVRTPGYIHNFKHVHWIDFVTCSDPSEQSKVIIEVNSKTYKAILDIETVYLSDNPTSKAYLIHLNNLRTLTLKENGDFSEDIARKKPPKIEPTVGHAFNLSKEEEAEMEEAPELEGFKPFENIQETLEVQEETPEIQEPTPVVPLDISFDDDIDEPLFSKSDDEVKIEEPVASEDISLDLSEDLSVDSLDLGDLSFEDEEEKPQKASVVVEEDDDFDYSYNFDPQVASDELGLPTDLIEEFIEDFIAQAKEFKEELYGSLDEGDLENIKVLSHKLKGVAANLRIEDAFNTLSIVNTTSDITEVEKYLKIFYKIIAKLSGEEISTPKASPVETTEAIEENTENKNDDDDLYDDLFIDFKSEDSDETDEDIESDKKDISSEDINLDISEETEDQTNDEDLYLDFDIDIKDSDVPQKIEMSELADDDFLDTPAEDDDIDDLLSIDEEMATDIEESDIQEEEVQDKAIVEEPIELPEINYSKELIASEIGLDQESFNEIFDDYIIDSKSSINSMRDAVSTDDFSKCKKEAIKLKGMSDNMRVNVFKDELANLLDSSDKEKLTESINKIDAVIAQISK